MRRSSRAALSFADRRRHSIHAALRLAFVAIAVAAASAPIAAQQHQHEPAAPATTAWQWNVDGNVFFGFNYQHRKFRDFSAWESQNWLMADGGRRFGSGTFAASAMLSLEAWTLKDIGSPQAFQTGETFGGAPLIDYQHPHDLIMGLGATYRLPWRRVTWQLTGALVGSPAFGPTVFMHRASATDHPQSPLSHHYLDSTHITPGVITLGGTAGEWTLEGSWFKGREPDENRTDLDVGAPDSYSVRLGWARGAWRAQASGASLTTPELVSPYDAKKLSASLSYDEPDGRRLAWTFAFGQNREIHGNLEAYLLEGRMQIRPRDTVFARAESVAKDILDAGFHPAGTFHRHRQSQVGALTAGYVRDVWTTPGARVGIGGDLTGYLVPDNLREAYGRPVSFHVFLRYRPGQDGRAGITHVH
jgi:hypothetical protein